MTNSSLWHIMDSYDLASLNSERDLNAMKINITNKNKSIPGSISFELPAFTVLTGENGSGKTQLLESIHNSKSRISNNKTKIINSVYSVYNGLIPKFLESININHINKIEKEVWSNYINFKREWEKKNRGKPIAIGDLYAHHQLIFSEVCKKLDISLSDINEIKYMDVISDIDITPSYNLFAREFSIMYKKYHLQHYDNMINKVQREEGIIDCPEYLSKEDFKKKYGDEPWILVNTILKKLKLPYKSNNPMGQKKENGFEFKLTNIENDIEINVSDLSTGEKTILSLALILFNGEKKGSAADMLLLDEPDAPLHPSMSKLLLEILEKEIVEKYNIPVIMTTHSATTIALAPPYSLYKISKDNKIPQKCDMEDSIRILSLGIPNLRVSQEDRRQVFVESGYDVEYLTKMFEIVSRCEMFDTLPIFLPTTSKAQDRGGSNCDDVIKIVKSLFMSGNSYAYGLIDWDKTNKSKDNIIVLGDENRYSIENYIFDPVHLGLYLLQKRFVQPSELGLNEFNTYNEVIINLSEPLLQKIVVAIEDKITFESSDPSYCESILINGYKLNVREDFYTMKGHDLEDLCKSTWPQLESVSVKTEHKLKNNVIDTVINDFPQYLSKDILVTFKKFV